MLKYFIFIILILALTVSAFLTGCGSSSIIDLLPDDNLPAGVTLADTHESEPSEFTPEEIGDKISIQCVGKYESASGDTYVVIIKCRNKDAAVEIYQDLQANTFEKGVFTTNPIVLNGNEGVEGYAASTQEYVYIWQKNEHVCEVVGNSKENALLFVELVEI